MIAGMFDHIDMMLLRVGTLPQGVMSEVEPITALSKETTERCDTLCKLGYLIDIGVGPVDNLHHYVTTENGLQVHAAFYADCTSIH